MRVSGIEWIKLKIVNNVKNAGFILMLIICVATLLLAKVAVGKRSDDINVLLYNDGSKAGAQIISKLTRLKTDGFVFTECESEDEIIALVTRSEAECGVIFDNDFDKNIKKGRVKKSILFYQSAQSSAGYIVREMVFPFVLEQMSDNLLVEYVNEKEENYNWNGTEYENALELIKIGNKEFRDSADINIFTISEIEGQKSKQADSPDMLWGIILWLVFAASLLGVSSMEKENRAVFRAVRASERALLRIENALCLNLPFAALISIIFAPRKIAVVVLYSIVCSLWVTLLTYITRTDKIYIASLPAILVISLIASPVVADLSVYLAPLAIVRRIFPIIYFM